MSKSHHVIICAKTAKHSHASRGAAAAQLRSLKKVRSDYNGSVYPCAFCLGWHIGREKKKAHLNKYRRKHR